MFYTFLALKYEGKVIPIHNSTRKFNNMETPIGKSVVWEAVLKASSQGISDFRNSFDDYKIKVAVEKRMLMLRFRRGV